MAQPQKKVAHPAPALRVAPPQPAPSQAWKAPLIFACGVWLAAQVLVLWKEAYFPGTDIFCFKDAGANLALNGDFAVHNLPSLPFGKSVPYASYAPLYPFVFGIWSFLAGLGWMQSALFNGFLQLVRTVLLASFCFPKLRSLDLGPKKGRGSLFFLFLVLVGVSLVSTEADRPEELAAVFGLLSWRCLLDRERSLGFSCLAGVMLGLTAATSSAAGAFFGLGFFLLFFPFKKDWLPFLVSLFSAAAIYCGCVLPFVLGASVLPTDSASTILPYLKTGWTKLPLGTTWDTFEDELRGNWALGKSYIGCAFALLLGVIVLKGQLKNVKELSPSFTRLFLLAPMLFLFTSFILWPLQPYYLWFSCLALLAGVLFYGTYLSKQLVTTVAICLVAFSSLFVSFGKGIGNAFEMPSGEQMEPIRDQVLKTVPEDAKLAVSYSAYFLFRDARDVSNIEYVCDHLNDFDYLFVDDLSNTAAKASPAIPCPAVSEKPFCFSLVQDFHAHKPFSLFAWKSGRVPRTFAGALYKNNHCKN